VTLASERRAITVVGIGDDGCCSLPSIAVQAVASAQWLVGGERQLGFFPEFAGEKIVIKGAITSLLERIGDLAAENNICVLASGDPLFYGIGSSLVRQFGPEHVRIIPHPSSLQWACARVGWTWEDLTIVSLHGRPRTGFLTRLRQERQAAVLTDPENSPPRLAQWMLDHNQSAWEAWVCENLCGPDERVRHFSILELAQCGDIGRLNVLLLRRTNADWYQPAVIPYQPEDAFAKRMPKKGLITKREVRMYSLAAMGLRPNSVVWDVGAGSGSVGIEAAILAPRGRVYAIEVDPESVQFCRDNLVTHAIDNVVVVEGRAPEALAGLEAPDAVFVGGSKGDMRDILDFSLDRLNTRGRLVVNSITLDNVAETYRYFRERKIAPEITMLQVSRGEPLAQYMRYEAMNPIHIFAVEKGPGLGHAQ
jgi:precorrin-6B C5,15-methyltransferase / cobalt-precorrin-6B C5,C15-methyltransferase